MPPLRMLLPAPSLLAVLPITFTRSAAFSPTWALKSPLMRTKLWLPTVMST